MWKNEPVELIAVAKNRAESPLLVVPSVLYGFDQSGYLLACLAVLPEAWGDALLLAAYPIKWAAVVTVPVLLFQLAHAVHHTSDDAVARSRTMKATAVWLGLGLATVIGFFTFADRTAIASAKPTAVRVWPGTETITDRPDLDVASDPAYNIARILTFELIAVAAIAVAAGIGLWACRKLPSVFAIALPLLVFGALIIYTAAAPGAWIWDYDPFIGDVVLGGVLAELVLFPAPHDSVGAIAIALAATSTWALTAAFRRTAPASPSTEVGRGDEVLVEQPGI